MMNWIIFSIIWKLCFMSLLYFVRVVITKAWLAVIAWILLLMHKMISFTISYNAFLNRTQHVFWSPILLDLYGLMLFWLVLFSEKFFTALKRYIRYKRYKRRKRYKRFKWYKRYKRYIRYERYKRCKRYKRCEWYKRYKQ